MRKYHTRFEERSAGAIVFYEENGVREYLLLKHPRGHWDLPKGNIESGESPFETARREVIEETGLKELDFYEDFVKKIEYYYRRSGGLVHKEVIFYLARSLNKNVRISKEHIGYIWLRYDDAIKLATFRNTKRLIKDAERFLKSIKRPFKM
jgi:8-oxo-dGTP pyrophosphatase MutT (NUDIX family)